MINLYGMSIMGTKISSLISKSRHEIGIADLSGKIVAFDAYNIIYAFLSSIRDKQTGGGYFTDTDGNVTSHLNGMFYRLNTLLINGVKPVFIFDGEPPTFKTAEIHSRKEKKEEAETKREEALKEGDLETAMKYAQATSRITPQIVQDAKTLLNYYGIPVINAPSEAEAQGSTLLQQGKIYALNSQDYDSFLFGGIRIVRNLALSQRRKVPGQNRWIEVNPEVIILSELLQELGFKNRDQLILLGLLIGTDYNPNGIKGVGPKTALKLVLKYRNSDRLLDYLDTKYGLDSIFPYPPLTLLEYFKNPNVDAEVNFQHQSPQLKLIQHFLVEERSFNAERVEKQLIQLKKKTEQKTLDRFFGN